LSRLCGSPIPLSTGWFKNGAHDPVLALSNEGNLMELLRKFASTSQRDEVKIFSASIDCQLALLEP
jgi:hypothetical protein